MFEYLKNGKIATPRGVLSVECVFNSEMEARKNGYEMYFSLNRGLCIFTKHIDIYHLLFAVVDKESPYKCKQVNNKAYYMLENCGKFTLLVRDKLIKEYQCYCMLKKEDCLLFADWCTKQWNLKKLCPDMVITLQTSLKSTYADIPPAQYVLKTSLSDIIYLTAVVDNKTYKCKVKELNEVGFTL